jgi:hypothetical protein
MQRIEKPSIHSAFWSAYPAGYLPYRKYRRKWFIGQSQQNCLVHFVHFIHFIEAIIFGDDETSSEFRPKIASLQNLVTLESSTRRHSPGAPQQARGG